MVISTELSSSHGLKIIQRRARVTVYFCRMLVLTFSGGPKSLAILSSGLPSIVAKFSNLRFFYSLLVRRKSIGSEA